MQKCIFTKNSGLYKIVIDYYAASARTNSDIYEILKVKYRSEAERKGDRLIWDFKSTVINLIRDQMPTFANIPTDEVHFALRRGLEIREARRGDRIRSAAESLSGEPAGNLKPGLYQCMDSQGSGFVSDQPSDQGKCSLLPSNANR